jgi:bisphosphoglycerate-dependent phosphoglycerate mutase family 1
MTESSRRAGRPRDVVRDRALLEAALAELEQNGYAGLTTAAVAKRAGVSTATLYRRWRSKDDLLAGTALAWAQELMPETDTGTLAGDLGALLHDKAQTLEEFGPDLFKTWRRSYDTPPPPIADNDPLSQVGDLRYSGLPSELIPRTECLADVVDRLLPYWYDSIVPDLASGQTVLVTAHGNSLRALVKHLDGIPDDEISELNIPTGIPLKYELDADFVPRKRGGEYLDPAAAAAAIEAVKNQGKK